MDVSYTTDVNNKTAKEFEMTEQAQAVQEFTDEALKIAEDEFNMTPEELAYNKVLIQRLAKELEKREVQLKQKRRIKAERRAANKTARKQRRVNRK